MIVWMHMDKQVGKESLLIKKHDNDHMIFYLKLVSLEMIGVIRESCMTEQFNLINLRHRAI